MIKQRKKQLIHKKYAVTVDLSIKEIPFEFELNFTYTEQQQQQQQGKEGKKTIDKDDYGSGEEVEIKTPYVFPETNRRREMVIHSTCDAVCYEVINWYYMVKIKVPEDEQNHEEYEKQGDKLFNELNKFLKKLNITTN